MNSNQTITCAGCGETELVSVSPDQLKNLTQKRDKNLVGNSFVLMRSSIEGKKIIKAICFHCGSNTKIHFDKSIRVGEIL